MEHSTTLQSVYLLFNHALFRDIALHFWLRGVMTEVLHF